MAEPSSSSGRLVHPRTLLSMFKGLGYEAGILSGSITPGLPLKSDLVSLSHHQPPGTKSETVPFYQDREKVAICHQYRRPDGSLGASGKPDPRMIRYHGRQYYSHAQPCRKIGCTICNAPPEDWTTIVG